MPGKTLYLLRHGESDLDASLDDLDRVLNPCGQRDARRMGEYLAQEGRSPARVLCSPARRAVETWEQFRVGLGLDLPVCFPDTLYLASPRQILGCLHPLPASVNSALIIGHNPGLTHLARKLLKAGGAQALQGPPFSAAGLAVIGFSGRDWKDVNVGRGELSAFLAPGDLV